MKLRSLASETAFSWKNFLWIGTVHILAICFAVPYFSVPALIAFFVCYYLSGMLGITLSFHRLLTHRAFKTSRFMENLGSLCGTLACQGGPLSWVAAHRSHHAYSDTPNDPHNAGQGFWHAHFGWLMNRRQDLDKFEEYKHYVPHLAQRPFLLWLENNMIAIQFLLGWVLFVMGGIVGSTGSLGSPDFSFNYHEAWGFVTWGIFVRLAALYHATWLVNSAAHKWGTNDNKLADLSKNNWFVGLVAFGEGWHNNHHAQPRSARHGWRWWQLDQTWLVIKLLSALGLVHEVTLPRTQNALVDEDYDVEMPTPKPVPL